MEEINWFALESKVRGIVREIIEPTIKRVQEIKETNEKLLRKEDSLQDHMTSLEITMSQTNQRVENINTFTGKIVESEATMRSFESKTSNLFDKVFSRFEIISADILNLSEKFTVLDKQKTVIEENVSGLEQVLMMTKTNFDKSLSSLQDNINKQFESSEVQIRGLDSNIRQINRKTEGISADLAETDYFARKAERVTGEHNDKFAAMHKLVQGNKKELQDTLDKVRNSIFSHYKEAQEGNKRLVKYIENDFKVSINMGMMEHLYSVVNDPRAMHRLAVYEKEKLGEWGNNSLQGSLREAIERSKVRCQAIIEIPLPEQPKKIVQNESKESFKQESISKDRSQISIESVLSKEEVKEEESEEESEEGDVVHSFAVETKDFAQEKQGFSNISMFAEPIYAPYPDVEIIDYMPFIQELKKELSDLRSEFSSEISKILQKSENLQSETVKTLNTLKEKQENFIDSSTKRSLEMEFLIKEALHECSMVTSLRKRDLSDISFSISQLEEKFREHFQDSTKNSETNSEISKKLSMIMEVVRISIALQQQDEVDRDSIALMGQKEVKLKGNLKKPVVTFDKNCMSCTGEKPMVQSLFKMACLAYTPSSVVYSRQEFSRKELIEIQKRMVEGIPSSKPEILSAVEEKQKNRARSALGMRRNRPNSVPFPTSNVSNYEVYSSVASELPIMHRRLL